MDQFPLYNCGPNKSVTPLRSRKPPNLIFVLLLWSTGWYLFHRSCYLYPAFRSYIPLIIYIIFPLTILSSGAILLHFIFYWTTFLSNLYVYRHSTVHLAIVYINNLIYISLLYSCGRWKVFAVIQYCFYYCYVIIIVYGP